MTHYAYSFQVISTVVGWIAVYMMNVISSRSVRATDASIAVSFEDAVTKAAARRAESSNRSGNAKSAAERSKEQGVCNVVKSWHQPTDRAQCGF